MVSSVQVYQQKCLSTLMRAMCLVYLILRDPTRSVVCFALFYMAIWLVLLKQRISKYDMVAVCVDLWSSKCYRAEVCSDNFDLPLSVPHRQHSVLILHSATPSVQPVQCSNWILPPPLCSAHTAFYRPRCICSYCILPPPLCSAHTAFYRPLYVVLILHSTAPAV